MCKEKITPPYPPKLIIIPPYIKPSCINMGQTTLRISFLSTQFRSSSRREAMNKLKKSEIVLLFGLTALLALTPLLSSSFRPTYLYFIFNLLIIALGAQAGLLSESPFPSPPHQDDINKPSRTAPEAAADRSFGKKHKSLDKAHSDKIPYGDYAKVEPLKKCPSASSIFFIGDGDSEAEEVEDEAGRGGNGGQELFVQAETFIGNFYKQLKMQKEESWKNIHGFYQKGL